ncbi:hypothetical protein H4219_003267 [Mycoemilia scoparia]|uniref:Uncharacterized protein n=1 Tax=Mycoemilia scoparia TaxID=417184 RepID=A0A9W8A1Q6_9FUNG|nr:hypothetical protein H4219_003267 [Mycoemilia scoparia]
MCVLPSMVSHSVGMAPTNFTVTGDFSCSDTSIDSGAYMRPRSQTVPELYANDATNTMQRAEPGHSQAFGGSAHNNMVSNPQLQHYPSDQSLSRKWAPKRALEDYTDQESNGLHESTLIQPGNPRYPFSTNSCDGQQLPPLQQQNVSDCQVDSLCGFSMSLPCSKRQKVAFGTQTHS